MKDLRLLQRKKSPRKEMTSLYQRMLTFFGRSDRVRTCGLNIPNVARYQLRHTPKYSVFFVKVIAEICAKRSRRELNSKITRCWVFGKCRKGKNCKRVSVFWRFVGCSPSGENSESVFRPRGAKDSVSFEYPYIIAKKCRVVNRQSDCS